MRHWLRAVVPLVLPLWFVASARADGLGPNGLYYMAAAGIAVCIGGLAFSLAVIFGGLWLVRLLRRNGDQTRHEEIQ
jgi:hypothetical protein